jgi:cytochrome c
VTVTVLGEDDPEARFRTLVFSKTAGFRHSSIDEGHAALEQLGDQHGFQVDHTEDSSLFTPEVLSRYDTVTFLSTTGDVLNEEQQAAFEAYIQGGGGYVGIHSASDTEYEWTWYGNLVGAYFRNHPANQTATVDVEDFEHPSTAGLPPSYQRLDEWYNFKSPDFATVGDADYSPRANVHVLAKVDESTYNEEDGNATDDDHPVTWCQRYDGGFSWYTAMGHVEESFTEANFLTQVLGGLETTAGVTPSATCGIPPGPAFRLSVDPESATVAEGGQVSFTVTVLNFGNEPAEDVELCGDAPKRVAAVKGKACRSYAGIPAGDSREATFVVATKKKTAGSVIEVSFTASSPDADTERVTATLNITN